MISVEEALAIIQDSITPTNNFERLEVSKAIGHTLFEDVISPINMPPFRQSAMDGYAVCINDEPTYKIIDEVKAGDGHHPVLKKGEAVRIFTGAPVPDTANAIIIQEKAHIESQVLTTIVEPSLHENIRPLGEQTLKGQTALKRGTLLTPAAIGYITSLGITEVIVYRKLSIAIVVTGNELAEAGNDLTYGQIYESNAIMLSSALANLHYQNVSHFKVEDNYKNTVETLEKAFAANDIVLVSGGISVGDYDFVGKALQELEVKQLFYKVKQKPGKPLFFGKKEDKIVFALPGNPAAALSSFYVYVFPAIQKLSGNLDFSLTRTKVRSASNYTKKGDRAQFLKAIHTSGKAEILEGQSSSMLHTFALANALVFVPESINSIKKNDEVEAILFPIN